MAPSLRRSAKVPRQAAQLASAKMELPSLAHSSPRKRSHPVSSRDPSRRSVASHPSSPQHQRKMPRLANGGCAQSLLKVTGDSHFKDTGNSVCDVIHNSMKRVKFQISPSKRSLVEPAPESNTENQDEVGEATEKAKLQQSPRRASRKHKSHLKDTRDSVCDLAQSTTKKAKLQTSLPESESRKPALKSNAASRDEVGNTANEKSQQSPVKASQQLETHLKDTGDRVCDVPQSAMKKAKLKTSPPERASRKSAPKSNAASRDEVGVMASEKVNLRQSRRKTLRKPGSHLNDAGDNVRDQACSSTNKAKLQILPPDRVSGKQVRKSNAAKRDEVGDVASEEAKSQQSSGKVFQKLNSHHGDTGDNLRDSAHSSTKKAMLKTSPPNNLLGQGALKPNTHSCDEVGNTTNEKAKLQESPAKVSQKPLLRSSSESPVKVENSAQKSKPQLCKTNRVLRRRVTKVGIQSSGDDDAACHRKSNLQNSPGKASRKPVLNSTAEKSNVDDATCSKKAKLRQSRSKVLREPVLNLEAKDSNVPDDTACNLKETMYRSHDKLLQDPVLKSDQKESSDSNNPPHSKKTRLLRSAHRAPPKLMLKSDTEDSTDVDDPDYKEKAKLLNLSSGILRERLLESDTDDSNDPTWEENTKWPRSSTGVPQKTTLRSNAESGQNALSRQPEKKKGRGPGRPKKKVWRGSVSVIHKPCEEEKNTQAVKGCKETPKTVMTSSNSTRQAERQVEEPYRETRIFAPLFRRPVCKRLREKCSVTGCPHADEAQSPTGLWLFALPDKTNEAELYSEWLRHVPIDDSINRPLSPRVCFKHFDSKKHFVSMKHRILGLRLDAVPINVLQPLKNTNGSPANAFRCSPKQCTSGANLEQASTSTTGVRQKPWSMRASRKKRKLQSAACATVMQEPQSLTPAGVAEEPQSTTAGAAQELQPPTTPVVGQESKCETSADVGVECHSVTPSGAAHKLQSMTASALIAMVQEPRSMTPVDDSSVSQPVKTNEEATKLQSTTTTTIIQQQHSMTSAAVTAEAQCLMAGGVAQESQPVATSIMGQELQSLSSADATSKSKPVGTEEAQNLHSTISATIARKSKSVTLADVGAETQPMMTAGVGQGSQCTCAASVMQASQSTTFDYDVNLQSQPVAIDKLVQKSWTAITASGAEESHCTTSANVTAETESKIAEVTQELQPTGTAIMVQESQCMAFENVSSEPPPVETDGETQKLEFAINSALVQELHSVASADIAAQTLSMTSAGVAQKSQSTAASGAAVDCDQHSKGSCESQSTATFADQGVESRSTEAAGTANGTQCTTGAAMSQEPESMDLVNTPVEIESTPATGAAKADLSTVSTTTELLSTTTSSVMEALQSALPDIAAEVQKSQSTFAALTGLQSATATSIKQKPQSVTIPDAIVESQFVTAAGTAQESQRTTSDAMIQEHDFMALGKVAAEAESIMAAVAAQAVPSTAFATTELHSTTTSSTMETIQSALPDVSTQVLVMTTASEVQKSPSTFAALAGLQSATATSIKQKPQSVTISDAIVESQFVTAAGTAQESQRTTTDAMIKVPDFMALAKVAAETESITAAVAAQAVPSTASATTELHSTTTSFTMEAIQSALPDVAAEVLVVTTASEVQQSPSAFAAVTGLQSATATSIKQKPKFVTIPDAIVESQFVTAAGTAQESQRTTSDAMIQEPNFMALAKVAAETESITAAVAAQAVPSTASATTELHSTTTSFTMEAIQSALPYVAAEVQVVTTALEGQKSQSTCAAVSGLASATATSIKQKPQSVTIPEAIVESQFVTAAGIAQESQRTTSDAMIKEPDYMALAKVAAEAESITAAVAAQAVPSTAFATTELHSTTTSSTMETIQSALPDVSTQVLVMTTASEVQKSPSTFAALAGLQSATATSIKQKPESVTISDAIVESQFVTAAGTAQESQRTTTDAMIKVPDFMTLAKVAAETESITAAVAAQAVPSTASATTELHSTTTFFTMEAIQSALPDVAAEALVVTTASKVQQSPSAFAAVTGLASATATSIKQKPQSVTIPDAIVESQFVTAAGIAQESQRTTSDAIIKEPDFMALAKVAAEAESITAAVAAQAVPSTASATTELHSTTTTSTMEAIQSALPYVAAEVQVVTTALEGQKSQSTCAAVSGLASATATSIKQGPQSATVADVTVKSQSVTAAVTTQEARCITSDAMIQKPQSMALGKVAVKTKSITAAVAAQAVPHTASATNESSPTTTATVRKSPQSALPDAAEVQIMTTHPEVEESRFTATAATGLQSVMATSMKRKPQSGTVVDGDMDSVRASGAARESQSAMMKEPQLQALSDVLASTLTITAAPKACKTESSTAAAMVQEPGSVTLRDIIIEPKMVIAPRVAQESHYMTISGVDLKTATTVVKKQKLQPTTFADLGAEFQSRNAAQAAKKPQSAAVTAMKPDLTTVSTQQKLKVLVAVPEPQSAAAIHVGCKSQSRTVAPAVKKIIGGQKSQSTTTVGIIDELESVAVLASEHKFQTTVGIGRGKECEALCVVDTVETLPTATAVFAESELQGPNSISLTTMLAADSKSKSKAKFRFHFPDSCEELEAEEQNVGHVPTSLASVRTESLEESTDRGPADITELIHLTDDRNPGPDMPSESPTEKSMQATSVSDKLVEQAEEIACYLATHTPVDFMDESTVSVCESPLCSSDCDDENIGKHVMSIPNEPLIPLTQNISMANAEISDTVPNKLLEFDLRTQQQALKKAVASSRATQMFSANRPTDINERMVQRGTNADIERDHPAPPRLVGSRASSASTGVLHAALEKPPASDVRTEAPLPREIVVPSAAALSRSLSNLTNSRNRAIEGNQRGSVSAKGMPRLSLQSCSSAQEGDRHVSSRAVCAPVRNTAIDENGRAAASVEPSASCSEPARRHRLDLPGRSSAVGAEKVQSMKAPSAGHLFHPSQGRYVLKQEVLQGGDELGMSAVFCTVLWVPTGSGAKT